MKYNAQDINGFLEENKPHTAFVVTDLVVEEFPLKPYIQMAEFSEPRHLPISYVDGDKKILITNEGVKIYKCPVLEFRENGNHPLFVAWSPTVEKVLQMPFRVLSENNKALNKQVSDLTNNVRNRNSQISYLQNRYVYVSGWRLIWLGIRRILGVDL